MADERSVSGRNSIRRQQVEAVCLDLYRLACEADSSDRLLKSAVDLIQQSLRATAVGFWLIDPSDGCAVLAAAAGAIAEPTLRAALSCVPFTVSVDAPCRPAEFSGQATQLWQAAVGLPKPAPLAIAPVIIRRDSQAPGVLIIWAVETDACELRAAADLIARDLAVALATIHRTGSRLELARLGATVFDFAAEAIVGLDAQCRCTRWNPAADALFGWSAAEVLDQPLRLVPAQQSPELWLEIKRALCAGGPQHISFVGRRRDGAERRLRARLVPLARTAGELSEALLMLTDETSDVSVRRCWQLEREVSSLISRAHPAEVIAASVVERVCLQLNWESGEFWQVSSDGQQWRRSAQWDRHRPATGPDADRCPALMDIDAGLPGRVRAERRIVHWHGPSQDSPQPAAHALCPERSAHAIGIPVAVENQIAAVLVFRGGLDGLQDPSLRRLLEAVAERLAHVVGRDVMSAALVKAEESLRQTQKMEAIGLLAGGIAHDFNNLLTVILGNAELVLTNRIAGDAGRRCLQEIQAAGQQGAALTRQLLTFSRKRPRESRIIYLAEVVSEMQTMLQRVAGAAVALELNVDLEAHPVRMDRVEFEQVLLNLTANARDAMLAGGRLTINLANAFLGTKEVAGCPQVRPGDFTVLTVADTGCGMDAATQARAFEPFFTTKEIDRGTGLGLATVYGIVRSCGGMVEIDSRPGAGTRCRVCFPRASVGIVPNRLDERPTPIPRGSETLIVVEDEQALRQLAQRILEVHGYCVHACASGSEALRLLQEPANHFDLLLTDVVMPHMSGPELVERSRRLRPQLPALLMSGYPSRGDGLVTDGSFSSELLSKPFTSEGLARAVRRQLDAAAQLAPAAPLRR